MTEHTEVGGSAPRWGPLFGARATGWAQTWEGRNGWGTSVYGHVLAHARIGVGTRVLDCGCGAGRFARMAADRVAGMAGIDAAPALVEIAASRTPSGEFRVGDLEALPWPGDTFGPRRCATRSTDGDVSPTGSSGSVPDFDDHAPLRGGPGAVSHP